VVEQSTEASSGLTQSRSEPLWQGHVVDDDWVVGSRSFLTPNYVR
jgi:hypothetical protein